MEWKANAPDTWTMKPAILAIALLLASVCRAETATVARIVDGDTLRAVVDGQELRVRLWGIDAPERGREGASDATEALARLAPVGSSVQLERVDVDRYGRTVARVIVNGEDVGERLVCAGYARWYRRYARGAANLAACEATARADARGVWSETAARP
ncbi:hypothetical protein F183_A29670 [Bryobacterales bacterium F-183]|nr:hypothetical protein F183_A29670 [Bryobacterales bacterium F-183]